MIFNSHAEGIGENTKENEPLEPIVIHEDFHTILNFRAAFCNGSKHSSEYVYKEKKKKILIGALLDLILAGFFTVAV